MTNITVYDDTANKLYEKAEECGTTVAEVVEELLSWLDEI